MKDELVSFKTAKLANEKGFDLDTLCYYDSDNELLESAYYEFDINNLTSEESIADVKFTAPTQSLLQRWLREKGLETRILMWHHEEAEENFYNGKVFEWSKDESYDSVHETGNWKTYEEALEYSLQVALKLIKDD